MKKIGIIGYGRFGKVLHDLLLKTFDVLVYDFNKSLKDIELSSLEEVLDCVSLTVTSRVEVSIFAFSRIYLEGGAGTSDVTVKFEVKNVPS